MSLSVSILIPCYNAEKWIRKALQSSVEQSWPNCEVIAIDDGSTDSTPEILNEWKDRVSILCRENRGSNPTRNELLELANGDWVQFLDADDYLLEDKIAHQMKVVESSPVAGLIYSPLLVEVHAEDSVFREIWDPHDPNGDHDAWAYHLSWNLTQTGGALFNRKALISAGGWNEEVSRCQDNELFFRLLKAGVVFERCPSTEAVYRRFAGGTISTSNQTSLVKEILGLVSEGECYLRTIDQLTPRRLQAANQNRLSLARKLWSSDREGALLIMETVYSSDPEFQPTPAPHSPTLYRIAFRLAGFKGAERMSALKRILIGK